MLNKLMIKLLLFFGFGRLTPSGYGLFLGSCALLCVINGHAQQRDTASVTRLNEVKIIERQLSKQNQSATPMQTINGADLLRVNSLSVADAIRYFSGVQLKDYGGIGGLKTINVRSMGANHTAVFFDGLQIGNAQNGQVDLGKFSLAHIEEITLYSGQRPTLLLPAKAYASASSVYLKSKRPYFVAGQKQQLGIGVKSGSFGLANPMVDFSQKLGDSMALNINTEYLNSNGRYRFRYTNGVYDTVAFRQNGDIQRFRLQASLFGQLKRNGNWQLQAYSFLSERGLPGAIIANRFDYPQRAWDRNFFVQGKLEQQLTNKLSMLVNAKYANDYLRFVDPEYIKDSGFLDNRFGEQQGYASVGIKYSPMASVDLAYISDYDYQTLDANLYRFVYPTRHTFLNVAGASLTLKRLTLQFNLLNTRVLDKVKQYAPAGSKNIWSPTAMFSWRVFNAHNLRVRGFYKDIFRMPTFNDLYYTFVGNTLLNPEFTKQYDLGLTYYRSFKNNSLQYVDLQVDGYYNQVKDKIIAQPGANLLRWIMYNIGQVAVKGVDVNLKMGFMVAKELVLNMGINYTYQQAEDVSLPTDDYGRQIPYVPFNSGSFIARCDYRKLKLNYSFIYTGYRYSQKANIIENYMQPWYTHDASVGYSFLLGKHSLVINGEANNLLNQYFDVVPNFPMPGRNYRLSLRYTL